MTLPMLLSFTLTLLVKLQYFWTAATERYPVPAIDLRYLAFSLFCATVLFLVASARPGAWWRWSVLGTANLGTAALVQSSLMCYRIFGEPLSFDMLVFADHLGDVHNSMAPLLDWRDLVLIGPDLAALAALAVGAGPRLAQADAYYQGCRRGRVFAFALAWLFVGLALTEPRGTWYEPLTRHHSTGILTFNPLVYYSIDAVRHFVGPLVRQGPDPDVVARIRGDLLANAQVRSRVPANYPWVTGSRPHTATPPNVLLVQVESLMQSALNRQVGSTTITPTIDALASCSVVLSRFYSQVVCTSDADFTVLTSLLPLEIGMVHFEAVEHEFVSLPRLLAARGYTTFYANGVRRHFWNVARMNARLGFQRACYREDLATGTIIGLGLADHELMPQLAERIAKLPRPYMAMVLTSSSHHPFNDNRLPRLLEPHLVASPDREFCDYANAIHYTDKSLHEFFDRLQTSGALENTLVVLYGDHQVLSPHRSIQLLASYGHLAEPEPISRFVNSVVPCLISWDGVLQPGRIERICGLTDVAPTVLGLLGLEVPPEFLGNSVFSPQPTPIVNKHFIGRDETRLFFGRAPAQGNFAHCVDWHTLQPVASYADLAPTWQLRDDVERILRWNLGTLLSSGTLPPLPSPGYFAH